ncbi:MAG: GAF domain-containing protein [Acidimicrobiales bacterium]
MLNELGKILDATDRMDDAATAVLGRALGLTGGRRGLLCLRHSHRQSLRIVAEAGYPAEIGQYWGEFPLGADLPASEAARTGRPVLLRTLAERDERYPELAGTPVVEDPALACIPLCFSDRPTETDRPLGCLVIGFAQSRTLSDDELWFMRGLAELAAVWLAAHVPQDG